MRIGSKKGGFLLALAVLVSGCSCHRSAPASVQPAAHAALAAPVLYSQTLVVPPDASDLLKRSVADAAQTLRRMTGVEFTVASTAAGGGILLVRASSKAAPAAAVERLGAAGAEAFVLVGADPDRFWIVANDDLGLVAGLYDYLRLLGCRWLLPGDDWTIVPHRADIRLTIDQLDKPAFLSQSFGGTGGVGKSLFDPKRTLSQTWDDWKRRNGFGGAFLIGGHTGEVFNLAHRAVLEAHPEYLALLNGKRTPWYIGAKLCVSNPDAVKLYIEDRIAELRRHPQFAISVEPADGGNHCECARCRAIGSGSVSDQVFYLANQVARAVAKEFPGGKVSLYAYSFHAALPTLPIEPNVYVAAIPDAWQRTGLSPDDLLRAWAGRTKSLGIYTYWGVTDWDNDLPTFDWRTTPRERIRFWHRLGLQSLFVETSYASGPMGLGLYLSSRLLWDPATNDEALADEFFRLAFEKAAPPMRRIFERWADGFMPNHLALAYRDLAEASRLSSGENADVKRRIKDYEEFVQYVRLSLEYQSAPVGSPERREKARAVVRWLYRIEPTGIVATFRLQYLVIERYEHDSALRAEFNQADGHAPGWQGLAPPTDAEVAALMAEGRAAYRPLDVPARRYSSRLVPLRRDRQPLVIPSSAIRLALSTDIEFEVPPGRTSIAFDILVSAGAKVPGDVVTATSPDGHLVYNELVPPDGVQHQITVPTPSAGRYRVHVEDQKAIFLFTPPPGVPMALRNLVTPVPCPAVYFFVPKGLRQVALYAPGAVPIRIFDADGRAVPGGGPGLVVVGVPPGQDGRVWSLKNYKAWQSIRMLNLPQSFSLSADTVLVPEEVAP